MNKLKSFLVDYFPSVIGGTVGLAIPIIQQLTNKSILTSSEIIIFYSGLILLQVSILQKSLKNPISEIRTYTQNEAITEPVRESNFHDVFKKDIKNAKNRVYVTYFNNQNPREDNDPDIRRYYEEIEDIVRKKNDVQFIRIVRGIPQVEDWIDYLVETHEGRENYSLACTMDEEPDDDLKSHVPVQLIDDEITYFVAVGEQDEYSDPRDMFIRSEEVNTQWERYYDRLWKESLELISRGEVDEDNLDEYKQHIEELRNG